MKKKIVLFSVLAVFVLFAVIAVSSALADRPPSKIGDSRVWFDPEDSSAEYCETVDVDVWIQTDVPSAGFYGVFDYTFCCANVTDFVGNYTNWDLWCEANLAPPGHVKIVASVLESNPANQPVHIGTLTIHCCDETSSCLTDLVWDTSESYIEDPDDNEITPVAWHDGTFACESQEKPDLEIVEKGEEWVNETHYTVSYVIHNNGTAVAPACHNTTLYVDGVAREHKHVPVDLAYCETYTDTFDTTIECSGDFDIIRVCADNYEVIDELDETNNCLENEWRCKEKKPDLEIVEKGEEWVNETHYTVSYVIHNNGTAVAPACHNTTLYVDGVAREHKHVPVDLAYCETYTDTFDTTIECSGDFDIIRVCADNYEVIDELDETNNCLENEWICKEKKPDLEIVEKGEEWVNETHYTVSYVIHNNGTAVAPACHNTTLYVDGVAREHKHVPVDLAYCETYTDTFDTTIECSGDFDIIRVCADNYEVIDELDEMNNCLENEWICPGKPDLEIVEKGEEWVNETHYTVSYVIHNNGTAIAPACHNTTLYVDGVAREHKHVPVALAYCETYTDTFDTTIECTGDVDIIRVCADNYEVIDELDEMNNCLENEWICPGKPDLEIVEKGEEWVNGTHYTVSYVIHNNGTAIAPACHNTTLYVDGQAREHKHVPVALAYCETYTDTFDTTIECTGDSDTIRVCADNYEVIDELDEMNNCLENEWICPGKPDLEIVEKGEEWVNETHYTVSYVIHNNGTAIAPACHNTTLYVDGQAREHKHVPVDLAYCETYTDTFDTTIECTGDSDTIRVCADNYEVIDELDEMNNCLMNEWICPGKPDLEIVEKGEEWVNETHYTVSYVIHNNGTAIAPACHNTTLYVDGQAREHKHVPVALAYCETYTDTFDTTIACTGDSDTIRVCADNYEVIDELDETNNCLENEWICKEEKPDLTVTEITVNYDAPGLGGRAIGPEPGPDVHTECNNLSAVIAEENGVDVLASFDVTFELDGATLCTVLVPGLTGGANKTVYCNCSWYPMAGDDFAIDVTADSNHEIPETNETNNTKWNNGTAVSNGYKGDGWQGPDKNLENVQCHDQDTINLIYSVGDSEYVSGSTLWTDYTGSWTTTDLPVPGGAEIQKAMLYVYYTWDKNDVMPDNVNMAFNGNNIALARHYSDSKGFGGYNYPSGMLIYDVVNHFTATGTNNAVLTKTAAADVVSMRGMLLMVVYKHPDEPERIIYIDEGYDMLYAKDSYAVSSEEATTYAPFTCCEPVPVEELDKATLIAVAPSASDGDDMNRLSFNDGLWNGIWDHYEANTQLGIAVADVFAYLKAAENRANFQSHIPAGEDKGDFMDASNAFLILEKRAKPDLTVTEITVNYDASSLGGRAIGPEPGPDVHTECNNLSAVIAEENGVDVGSPFDVTFELDGTTLCTVLVPGLTGGANKTVYCDCSWYPMAGDVFAIDVTVDSNHEISETNETNNTNWNNGTAVSNGYKGDGWQGPDKNLINVQCHDQDTINLTYSVGDSEYVSGSTQWTDYTGSWTTTDLPVPDSAEIQKAMLYVYYTWDKNDVMPDNVNMAFNGNNIALARDYSDSKGFGGYNYPSGMLVYDVRSHFTATGPNNAVLTKAVAADVVSMRGMLLMVVYKHPDEPERIIYIDEGYDMLYAKDSYAVSSEEATTYAPFTRCEPVPVEELDKATLIAVAPSASDGDDMNRLSFNDGLWPGAWSGFAGATQLGIAEANVLAYLEIEDNRANFQSHIPAGEDKGDFMDASNAFLILEKRAKPDLAVTEITVNYDASSLGGRAIGPVPGPDVHTECNNLSAVIAEEDGVDVLASFDVTFEVDGATLCTVRVPGLTGGANKTVYCNCSWYPYAGDAFAIDVTADSNHEISETNETNNTNWNNGTAVSNGYKGDGWQGPDKNLINEQCHDQDTINLIYSVGDSEYVSGSTQWTEYAGSWTTTDLPVPGGAEIQKAMLYVYYTWDKNDVMPDNVNMAFNGNNIALARDYSDSKGFGGYNYPSGMLIYDVVNHFTATGTNNAVLTKTAAADVVSMRGMLLMVVYKHPDEPERIIYIDEGYDMLYAKDSYAVSSEEATTYAPFTCCEPVPVEELVKATLIAVAPSAKDGDDMNRLSFNDGLWNGIWDHYEANTQLGIAVADVFAYLKAAENRANFQSHIPAGGDKGDFMDASNAFLILEKKGEIPCPAKYAVYQANVSDPEEPLNKLRALRDNKLEDGYVTRYYEYSPMLTLVLSRADSDLVKDGAQLVSKYSIPVGLHVQGMDVDERITKQDVEEALSFTDRLKREVMKNRDAIGVKSTEAIIVFIDEFEGQVKASEGKTFSAALKSSIYYEGGQLRAGQTIVKE